MMIKLILITICIIGKINSSRNLKEHFDSPGLVRSLRGFTGEETAKNVYRSKKPYTANPIRPLIDLIIDKLSSSLTTFIDNSISCDEVCNDSDLKLDAEQLISSRGFKAESHSVVTADGITLILHRIINPYVKLNEEPILSNHPLLGSSVDFILNSPGGSVSESVNNNDIIGNNLAFELAKRGYDVWLANVRGNIYSSKNFNEEDWDFSLDEIIQYDMPAMINYIIKQTRSNSINYIGHSQGANVMFGLLSIDARFNKLIKRFIALAPAIYLRNIPKPLRLVFESSPVKSFLESCSKFLYNLTILPAAAERLCPLLGPLCETFIFSIVGFNYEQWNRTRLPIYINHIPAGTSCKNVLHFIQLMKSDDFPQYDYGWQKNLLIYGDTKPPIYDLSKITLNNTISIIFGANDFLASPPQIEMVRSKLKIQLVDYYPVKYPYWNHIDYFWSKDVGKLVNVKIFELLTR